MANAHTLNKFYISNAAVSAAPVNLAAYNALSYTEIKGVGSLGETGTRVNILQYDTWGDSVIQKAKGLADAGSPELECARIATDPGQILARTAASGNLTWAFKTERNDKLTGGGTNTLNYNWGLIAGPSRPEGRNEDFDLEVFMLGFMALETVQAPT